MSVCILYIPKDILQHIHTSQWDSWYHTAIYISAISKQPSSIRQLAFHLGHSAVQNGTSCSHKVFSPITSISGSVSNVFLMSFLSSVFLSLTYTNFLACIAAFPSPPPSMKVVECKQLNEDVNTCAWTSCSGCFLYNWPLRMHTSTIGTRMIRPTMMTATPRQHPITMYTTGIGEAAGRNVYSQWRTTQSLWIAWRNVHWVGGTHALIYCRYKQMIIHHFGPRDSPQVDYLLDAWEGDSACVDWLLLVHIIYI